MLNVLFGILKGQWRILKSGIRLEGVDKVDKVKLTCCALHNWLLEIEGRLEEWSGGRLVSCSDWDGPLGQMDFDGVKDPVTNASHRVRA